MGRAKGSLNKKHKPSIISICKQCEAEIIDQHKRVFCSHKCKADWQRINLRGENNPYWKPTKKLRASNKNSLRRHIKARDKVCQDCGDSTSLQVHHNDMNPLNNDDSNLLLLCKKCHAQRHITNGDIGIDKLILVNRTYKQQLHVNCCICNKSFIPKRKIQLTCSRNCQIALWSRNRKGKTAHNKGISLINVTCYMCGKEFTRRKCNIKSTKVFCSKPCQIKYAIKCRVTKQLTL